VLQVGPYDNHRFVPWNHAFNMTTSVRAAPQGGDSCAMWHKESNDSELLYVT